MVVDDPSHKVEIIGPMESVDGYPLASKNPSLEYLRNYLHLRPKTNYIPAMARVRNALSMATHQFF